VTKEVPKTAHNSSHCGEAPRQIFQPDYIIALDSHLIGSPLTTPHSRISNFPISGPVMTNQKTGWISAVGECHGPAYLSIVAAIETAVRAGRLHPGDTLPSQRFLADFMGLHVNTVNRAMREAARRGLTSGKTRRGTKIR
jgi:GntR family transcriptional regulator